MHPGPEAHPEEPKQIEPVTQTKHVEKSAISVAEYKKYKLLCGSFHGLASTFFFFLHLAEIPQSPNAVVSAAVCGFSTAIGATVLTLTHVFQLTGFLAWGHQFGSATGLENL